MSYAPLSAPVADGLQTAFRERGNRRNAPEGIQNFADGVEAGMIHPPPIIQNIFARNSVDYSELRGQSNPVACPGMKEPKNVESREAIGYRLELTRLALGLTRHAFATSFGIAPQGYTNFFTPGRSERISVDAAVRLCRTHGVSLDWIYRGQMYAVRGDLREKIERIRAEFDSKGRPARATS